VIKAIEHLDARVWRKSHFGEGMAMRECKGGDPPHGSPNLDPVNRRAVSKAIEHSEGTAWLKDNVGEGTATLKSADNPFYRSGDLDSVKPAAAAKSPNFHGQEGR
jgi:hypothetical protein